MGIHNAISTINYNLNGIYPEKIKRHKDEEKCIYISLAAMKALYSNNF